MMLRLDKVSKFYSQNGVVTSGFSQVSLSFNTGEFVAITGESGSGKSTLLNVISGLDSYEEGEMYWFDEPTSGYSTEEMEDYRKRYIGSIFQTFNLINSYTVYQNIELVLLLSGYKRKEIKKRVNDIIDRVGLSKYRKTKTSKLSGGQKQRVAIARALAKETPIIVADEPTGNLDVKSAEDIFKLLASLSRDKLVIIVTHNYEQVEKYVTRKITMHDGRVVEDKKFNRGPAYDTLYKAEYKESTGEESQLGDITYRCPVDTAEFRSEDTEGSESHLGDITKDSKSQLDDIADNNLITEDKATKTKQGKEEGRNKLKSKTQTGKLSAANTIRLGVRNAFSLPAKFVLLLVVFLFLCGGTFLSYSTTMSSMEMSSDMYYGSWNFHMPDPGRVVLKKKDMTPFTDNDIEKLSAMDNIKEVIPLDMILDTYVYISNFDRDKRNGDASPYGEGSEDDISIQVKLKQLKANDKKKVVSGRLPEKNGEALLAFSKEDSFFKEEAERALEIGNLYMYTDNADIDHPVTLTGICYMTEEEDKASLGPDGYTSVLYGYGDTFDVIKGDLNISGTTQYVEANKTKFNIASAGDMGDIIPSAKVPEGEVYVSESVQEMYDKGEAKGKPLNIRTQNIYLDDTKTYTIGAVYTAQNAKALLGKNYVDLPQGIYMNVSDYSKQLITENYQASVFIKETFKAEETLKTLEDAGFKTLYLKDYPAYDNALMEAVQKFMNKVGLVVKLAVLFFIVYFIMRLIYKSQNIYFSTVRMLGGSKGACRGLIITDMLVIAHIAYIAVSAFIYKVKDGTINQIGFFNEMAKYIEAKDFAILYCIIVIMAALIALRYAGKLFKSTALTTYKEEV